MQFDQVDFGRVLQLGNNYTTLRRIRPQEQDVFYYRNDKGLETDFVVCKGNKALALYQVCYDMSSLKTRNREINGLLDGSKATRCDNLFIITDFQHETITKEGKTIQVIPAYDWMLQEQGIYFAFGKM